MLGEKPLEGAALYDRGEELAEVRNGKIKLNSSKKYGIEEIERFEEKIQDKDNKIQFDEQSKILFRYVI